MVQMTGETFQKRTNDLLEKVMDKDRIEHKLRIVPAPFCDIWYISDTRCFPGHTTLKAETLKRPMAKNM